ncbi:hypothetical protein [Clostridium sp. C8-1-8]|uniref:hypothetical protein n=1 Tax=Clostridium sp. C8-1-8 TaxID=2698831 RepID=UPI00136B5F9E|nr:hypothetical protein [Clostridium sp. C8-1-8]
MKKLRTFLIWTVIALLIENGVFLYFEKVYLVQGSSIKAEKVEKKKASDMKDVSIPSEAKSVKMSHDGSYVSYLEDGVLKIGDRTKGTVKTVEVADYMSVNYTKWVTDGNFLIIAEKTKDSKKPYIGFYKYDAVRDDKTELTDLDLHKDIINLSSSKDNIEDMAFATSSNVMYFKLGKPAGKCDIYKINVMAQMEKVKANLQGIDTIEVDPVNANLIYEQSGMVKINTGSKQTRIKNLSEGNVLGHSDSSVFIAKGKSDSVSEIVYGDVEKPASSWQIINIDNKTSVKNIFLTSGGRIFVNNSNKTLTDLTTKKNIKYEGTLLDVNDRGVLCEVDGQSKVIELE